MVWTVLSGPPWQLCTTVLCSRIASWMRIGNSVTLYSGRELVWNLAVSVYRLTVHTCRYVEMSVGVTASCMPTLKQFFSRYACSMPSGVTSRPSLLSLRRPAKERMSDPGRGGFRQWGYQTNADTESTTRIGHGAADAEMDQFSLRSVVSHRSRSQA